MKLGWSNNDACKAVGISRKTETRWLLGRHVTTNSKPTFLLPAENVRLNQIPRRFRSAKEHISASIFLVPRSFVRCPGWPSETVEDHLLPSLLVSGRSMTPVSPGGRRVPLPGVGLVLVGGV